VNENSEELFTQKENKRKIKRELLTKGVITRVRKSG